MSYFPLCVDLTGKTVVLIGQGQQIEDKQEKLRPFGARLVRKETFAPADAQERPAFVVVGDRDLEEAERICELCRLYGIPVNVVDVPRLCSFYFPALITRGKLTVSVSTGGGSPAAAGYLRRKIEESLPDRTEEILNWLSVNREEFKKRGILKQAIAGAFAQNAPLTEEELSGLETSDPLPR